MDLWITAEIVLFLSMLGLSAFFSSSETALFSLNPLQLEEMRRSEHPRTRLVEEMLSRPRQLIVTILIGNEFVNICASVISAALVIQVLGDDYKWANLLIMVPLLLLFGEITPKTIAIRNNVAFACYQSPYIDVFSKAITPLRWIVRQVSDLFITMAVGSERSRANILTEDMVRSLAKEAVGEGALDKREALYIQRIFDMGDRPLHEIMTPRSQVFCLAANASLEEAALSFERTGHTKVPVTDGGKDDVIGILYVRDLIAAAEQRQPDKKRAERVSEVMRGAFYIPGTKSAADLFYSFRKRKLSLALVVDEYGGVTGLVTMEDVLECIFGEITSRSETLRHAPNDIRETGDGRYRANGSVTLHQLNRCLGTSYRSESFETIGGLLLNAFGEMPAVGDQIVIEPLTFSVEAVMDRRIVDVTITTPDYNETAWETTVSTAD